MQRNPLQNPTVVMLGSVKIDF